MSGETLSDSAETSGPMKDTDAMTEGNHVLETGYRTVPYTLQYSYSAFTDIPPRSQRLINVRMHCKHIARCHRIACHFPYAEHQMFTEHSVCASIISHPPALGSLSFLAGTTSCICAFR